MGSCATLSNVLLLYRRFFEKVESFIFFLACKLREELRTPLEKVLFVFCVLINAENRRLLIKKVAIRSKLKLGTSYYGFKIELN